VRRYNVSEPGSVSVFRRGGTTFRKLDLFPSSGEEVQRFGTWICFHLQKRRYNVSETAYVSVFR
jgi:hypothetical protein